MEYSNGIVGDMCVHMFDMIRWIMELGWPKRIGSSGGILVDKKSHLYIDETEVDWSYNLIDRGLRFTNPCAKGSCGCGTSFIYEPPVKENTLPTFEFSL